MPVIFKPKSIVLERKGTNIKLISGITENVLRGYSKQALVKPTEIKEKLKFVEKLLEESKYKKSDHLIFLDENELTNFISFSKFYKKKIKNKEHKFLSEKLTPTLIEILKELSAYTERSTIKENISFFNNFLEVYNVFKKFNPDKEPSKKLFSLMFYNSYKGKEEIKRIKKVIALRYS